MEPNANSAQHQQSEHRQPHDQQEVPVAGAEIDGEQQLFRRRAAQQSRKGAAPHDQPADEMKPMQHDQHIEKGDGHVARSEEHTSELQSLMRISYAVFCLKKKNTTQKKKPKHYTTAYNETITIIQESKQKN